MIARPTQHVLLLGATGTAGRATAAALRAARVETTCLVRPGRGRDLAGMRLVEGAVGDPSILDAVMARGRFDAVISCLASRSGAPAEAWAIDHAAHSAVLHAALAHGVGRFVLLSAICVQKPRLAFQHAKLAFEAELSRAPISWSILRATALFKSLSGQVARVRAGKPFLVFGDGRLTACKPISDADLARALVRALDDPAMEGRILPVGGPGPALTPLDQAGLLCRALDRPVRVRRLPVALIDGIAGGLGVCGRFSPRLAAKADLARIGRYYATESMLVLDPATDRFDAAATPEYGSDTLAGHYRALAEGRAGSDLGAHSVF